MYIDSHVTFTSGLCGSCKCLVFQSQCFSEFFSWLKNILWWCLTLSLSQSLPSVAWVSPVLFKEPLGTQVNATYTYKVFMSVCHRSKLQPVLYGSTLGPIFNGNSTSSLYSSHCMVQKWFGSFKHPLLQNITFGFPGRHYQLPAKIC